MHAVFTFDGGIDAGALRKATMRTVASDPYTRSRYTEVDGRPVWEEIAEEEWERAFVLLPAGEDVDMPPPPLDVRAGPQVRVGLYRRAGGDIVAVTCHHGFCDVSGTMALARDIFAAYRGIMADPGYRPPPREPYDRSTDHILMLSSDEERRRALAEEEPFIDRWRFPADRTGRGTPRIASRTLAPDRLGRMKAFGREHGATVNDVLIGAFFLALLDTRDDPADRGAPRSILTSADLRRRYPGCHGEGLPVNLSVAYDLTLTVEEGAGLEDIIGQVTAITARKKAGNPGLAAILFYEGIMAGGMPAVRAFFDEMAGRYTSSGNKNPVFSNLGVFDPGDYLPVPGKDGRALDLRDIQYLPCVCWPYGFLMAASTFCGRLTITTAYEEGPYSTATVERFLGYVDGYLP
ncbi:hypothetical protein DSECCO2_611030 [anaerobic digester metagenome]